MSGFGRMLGRRHVRALTIVAIALAAVLPAGRAQAAPSQADCDARPNNTIPKMLECIRVGQVRAHQAALQEIANDNGGNRFAGLSGHNESVDYVVDTLEAAGWDVSLQEFDYTSYRELGPSALQQTAPGTVTYVEGTDFGVIDQSDPGDVTAAGHGRRPPVRARKHLDERLRDCRLRGLPRGEHRVAPAGRLHLRAEGRERRGRGRRRDRDLQPGQHRAPTARASRAVTLTANNTSGIPVLGTTYQLGETLAHTPGSRMRVFANTEREVKTDRQRDRRDAPAQTTTTSSWPARTSTRSERDRASTTTARAAPPSSRSPSRSPR